MLRSFPSIYLFIKINPTARFSPPTRVTLVICYYFLQNCSTMRLSLSTRAPELAGGALGLASFPPSLALCCLFTKIHLGSNCIPKDSVYALNRHGLVRNQLPLLKTLSPHSVCTSAHSSTHSSDVQSARQEKTIRVENLRGQMGSKVTPGVAPFSFTSER